MKRDIFLFSAFIFCVVACSDGNVLGYQRVTGKGDPIQEVREVGAFTGVALNCSADVKVLQGNETKVTIDGQKNIVDELETKVENGVLEIRFKSKYSMKSYSYKNLTVTVQTPNVASLAVSSSGSMAAQTPLKGQKLAVAVSGSGDIQLLEVTYEGLTAAVSSSGSIKIKNAAIANEADIAVSGSGAVECGGTAKTANMAVSGSGGIAASTFAVFDGSAVVSGSGGIECNVSNALDAVVSGSGSVHYVGKPVNIVSKANGSGSIKPL